MARLPIVGGDEGEWGEILNEYLEESHGEDGSLKSEAVGAAGAFMKSTDDLDDITDGTTYKKFSASEQTKLAGIEEGAQVNTVASVNSQTGSVALDIDDIAPSQSGNSGKVLKSDGTNVTWQDDDNFTDWGDIGGALLDQTDLRTALSADFIPGTTVRTGVVDDWIQRVREGTGPTNVVVIGDSLTVYQATNSYPYILDRILAGRVSASDQAVAPGTTPATRSGWRFAANGNILPPKFGTWEGSVNTSLTGRSGGTLTAGQKGNVTGVTDGITLVYRTAPGAGSIIVRDGVGGTELTTIDTASAAGIAQWTSNALSQASHTIEVEASGGTVNIDGLYFHYDNRTEGIRVFNAGFSGSKTEDFVDNAGYGLELIELFANENSLGAVVIGTGTNDDDNGADDLEDLVAAIRVIAPSVSIFSWIPYVAPPRPRARYVARWQKSIQLGLASIYGPSLLPDFSSNPAWNSGDNVHPHAAAETLIAEHIAAAMSGDPLGSLLRSLQNKAPTSDLANYLPLSGGTLSGTLNGTTINASTAFNILGGAINASQIFGLPGFVLKNAGADTQSIISLAGTTLNTAIHSTPGVGFVLGEGGSTPPDVNLYRAAANVLRTDDTFHAETAITTGGTVDGLDLGQYAKGFINHGSNASTARPANYVSVTWYGTVEPDNAITGDEWIDPS